MKKFTVFQDTEEVVRKPKNYGITELLLHRQLGTYRKRIFKEKIEELEAKGFKPKVKEHLINLKEKIEYFFGNYTMTPTITEVLSIDEFILAIAHNGLCRLFNRSKTNHNLTFRHQKDVNFELEGK